MSKDRNTFAKRQREVDRKHKATQKRNRRANKKQQRPDSGEDIKSLPFLSLGERSVLGVFRKQLMTPGKMLCLSGSDVQAFRVPLTIMTKKGLLIAEGLQGSYSLTEAGFAAMQDSA